MTGATRVSHPVIKRVTFSFGAVKQLTRTASCCPHLFRTDLPTLTIPFFLDSLSCSSPSAVHLILFHPYGAPVRFPVPPPFHCPNKSCCCYFVFLLLNFLPTSHFSRNTYSYPLGLHIVYRTLHTNSLLFSLSTLPYGQKRRL